MPAWVRGLTSLGYRLWSGLLWQINPVGPKIQLGHFITATEAEAMRVCPTIRMGPGKLWAATNPDQHECQCGVYEWVSLSQRMHIIHDQQQPGRDTGNSLDSDPLSFCGSVPITAHAHLNTHTVVEWFLLVYKQHDSKQRREGKRFSSLHFQFTVYDWGKLGQKLKKELKEKS